MEWLALTVWILVAGLALPVGLGALSGAPGLGLQAGAAIGGLAASALFIIFGGPLWLGWVAFGMAIAGIVGSLWGADALLSDEREPGAELQGAEELEAALLGIELPLLAVVLMCSLCLGADLLTLV